MLYPHFQFYKKQDILNITRRRRFETKTGECLHTVQDGWQETLIANKARFVLLGIPEDIGIMADYGRGGGNAVWPAFLEAFCNIQSTDFFSGEEVLTLGHFDFSDVKTIILANAKNQDEEVDACRHAVANIIDHEVEALVKVLTSAGKIPVVVGGGHNNAYPLIKGTAKGLSKAGKPGNAQLNVINADAHAHYSSMEGRHSGNSFRYAKEEGFLNKYTIIGLQENYNSQGTIDELYSNINIQYTTYEDIFVKEKLNFRQAIMQAISFTEGNSTGVELDLDAIEQSAENPYPMSGFTALQARQYVSAMAQFAQPAYLHICGEPTPMVNIQSHAVKGKFIVDLVSDFIKSYNH